MRRLLLCLPFLSCMAEESDGPGPPRDRPYQMVLSAGISPDGRLLAAGGTGGPVRIWDLGTGSPLRELDTGDEEISSVAWSPDGTLLASSGRGGSVRIFDAATGEERLALSAAASGEPVPYLFSAAFSPDGKRVAAGGEHPTLRVWDPATGKAFPPLALGRGPCEGPIDDGGPPMPPQAKVSGVAFSPDGKTLAVSTDTEGILLWDAGTLKAAGSFSGGGLARAVAFSPDGTLLASAHYDRCVRLWKAGADRPLLVLEGTDRFFFVAFSPDGKRIAAASVGETVLWNVEGGKPLARIRGHQGLVRAAAFSRDGRYLVTGGEDGALNLWDAGTWRRMTSLGKGTVESPASPEACWEALASDEGRAWAAFRWLEARPVEALALLKARLVPTATDPAEVRARIADLDDDRFEVRERASRRLSEMGKEVETALRAALAASPSAEARARMEVLLGELARSEDSPDVRRQERGLRLLEWVGTAEARSLLEALSRGPEGLALAVRAREALDRLSTRPRAPSP